MTGPREPRFAVTAGLLLAGLLVWTVHFVFIYGFVGLACARGWARPEDAPLDVASLAVLAATVVACGAVGWAMLAARRMRGGQDAQFLRWFALAVGVLALISIVWEGMAVLLVPACQ